jgi:hypothetical protein
LRTFFQLKNKNYLLFQKNKLTLNKKNNDFTTLSLLSGVTALFEKN